MYSDGQCFEGKEDHVWMSIKGFEGLNKGDCVSFFAEPYRYVKTGNGKTLDFGLRNPEQVTKIGKYDLPTDDELLYQELKQMICETCYLNEQCSRFDCVRNPKELRELKKSMKEFVKKQKMPVRTNFKSYGP